MNQTEFKGVIHGSVITLDGEPGLPDGETVTVILTTEPPNKKTGEGLRRAFGGWSDDPEGLEEYLKWNRQQRQSDSREIEP